MTEAVVNLSLIDVQGKLTGNLLATKLEQMGYQCLTDCCDRFTTLRLVPLEIKRKEELLNSSSE